MKKIALVMATVLTFGLATFSTPVMAENDYEPIIFTTCGSGDSEAIQCILNSVIDIMSVGIGILGVIGISIVGIQYLTAGGNEEQTRKAKRRMFEIVLGLVIYAAIAAILKFFNVSPPSS